MPYKLNLELMLEIQKNFEQLDEVTIEGVYEELLLRLCLKYMELMEDAPLTGVDVDLDFLPIVLTYVEIIQR